MPVHRQKKDTTPHTPGSILELVMHEELDAFIGAAWEKAVPNAKAFATAPTRAIWSHPTVDSRTSKCLEIGKDSFTRRPSTVAMNRTLPKG